MAMSQLSRLLACATLLLAVRRVSAGPTKNPIMQTTETCPVMVQVGEGYNLAHVAFQETLEFYLNPNLPLMSMRFLGDDMLYKATIDGTMVKLFQCDEQESNCVVLDEGGTKSRDLLEADEWNRILVKYINGEITVDVNWESSVMGGPMRMTKGPRKSAHGGGQVIFLVPPATPSYSAMLKIICSDVPPRVWTESPASPTLTIPTTTAPSSPVGPYQGCPLYHVEVDHPSVPAALGDHLTLAVYPTHPALHLIIANDRLYLKVYVDGSTAELLQCETVNRNNCSSKDRYDINEAFIVPEKWNSVTLALLEDKITMSINEWKEVLIASLQSPYSKGLKVSAMAPRKTSFSHQEHFVALVNVDCEGSEPAPTQEGLPTKAPIMDTTVEPAASGISRDVGIVVGVLVLVLLIIALAIVISTVKKRRSTAINEHSPLQNQHQQQEQ